MPFALHMLSALHLSKLVKCIYIFLLLSDKLQNWTCIVVSVVVAPERWSVK